jgi:hypothetical protein
VNDCLHVRPVMRLCTAASVAGTGEPTSPAGIRAGVFDRFWLFAVVMLAVTLVVFLMKRSVAEKGRISVANEPSILSARHGILSAQLMRVSPVGRFS